MSGGIDVLVATLGKQSKGGEETAGDGVELEEEDGGEAHGANGTGDGGVKVDEAVSGGWGTIGAGAELGSGGACFGVHDQVVYQCYLRSKEEDGEGSVQ